MIEQRSPASVIGARVRSCRRTRGLSQRALAELAGLSASFLSMVENGQRLLDRQAHIVALSDVLQVSPSELTGQPSVAGTRADAALHSAVPALRRVLMDLPEGSGTPARRPDERPLSVLTADVASATRLYHTCDYTGLATLLPSLLHGLQLRVESAPEREVADTLRLLVAAYHPACALFLKYLGYPDLAYLAVTRATGCVARLDDPLQRAFNTFFLAHSCLAAGAPDQAIAIAGSALESLGSRLTSTDELALHGELHLVSAMAHATHPDRHRHEGAGIDHARLAADHLAHADDVARRTGDTSAMHLNFGPTNVGIHRVSVAVELGAHARAAFEARHVEPRALDAPGRQSSYHVDLGRALAHLKGHEVEAVENLRAAERLAPHRTRANPAVRDTTVGLLQRQLPRTVGRDLRGLAHRIGVTV